MNAQRAQEPADPEHFEYAGIRVGIDDVIAMVDATVEDSWQVDVVRRGTRNCFFGHLHAYGSRLGAERDLDPDSVASALWDWFEECWTTTYRLYSVNDGHDPAYRQSTPRRRVRALLVALRDGDEFRTQAANEADYQAFLAVAAGS